MDSQDSKCFEALVKNDVETFKKLLNQDAVSEDQSIQKDASKYLLYIVANCESHLKLEAAEYLLEHGIDVNSRDSQGNTLLHLVSGPLSYKMTNLLLNYGADVNALNNEGHTALYKTIFIGGSRFEIILPLLLNGASLGLNRPCKLPDQHIKSLGNLTTVYDHLIDCEMGINTLDEETGNTPLHFAMMHGNVHLAEELLKRGANVNLVNKELWTPLQSTFESTGYFNKDLEYFLNLVGSVDSFLNGYGGEHTANINANLLFEAFEEDIYSKGPIINHYYPERMFIVDQYFDYVTNFNQTSAHSVFLLAINLMIPFIGDYCLHSYTYLMSIVIKMIAKCSMLGVMKGKDLLDKVNCDYPIYKLHMEELHEKYLEELIKLKNYIIYKKISFFDVLTDNFDKIVHYLQDEDFIENYKKLNALVENNKYIKSINRKIQRAQILKNINKEALSILEEIFKFTIPSLAINNIFRYLDVSDKRVLLYQQ